MNSDGWGLFVVIAGVTAAAVVVPVAILLLVEAIRSRKLRIITKNALLIGSIRTPLLTDKLAELGVSPCLPNLLVWSFDAEGARLWRGVFHPICVFELHRVDVDEVLIASDYVGRGAGSHRVDCLEICIRKAGAERFTLLWIDVRPLETPWTVRGGKVVATLRRRILQVWDLPDRRERISQSARD